MNRNLLVFSLFLIIFGVVSGVYLVSLFGIILLIPSTLPSARQSSRNPPRQTETKRPPTWDAARRMPADQGPVPTAQVAQPAFQPSQPPEPVVTTTPGPSPMETYSPALFPGSIFPPVYNLGVQTTPPAGPEAKKASERDDLVEAGTLFVLLKLFLG
ncbi:MAG: hypothetical protein JRN21_07795 [Nitrososphaerota archaeon]|nr:hypothetical protein [Nitrososphaerota archaeon]